jgi:hypothetical protein
MGTCIFCGKRAASNEHIFPDWLNEEFPNETGERHVVTRKVGDEVTSWPSWETAFLKIKAVCRECNHGWMGSIEGHTKPVILPLIRGEERILSAVEQLQLGTWAALKALVYDAKAQYESLASEGDRQVMYEQRRPPANYRVSLAGHGHGGLFMVRRVFVAGWQHGSNAMQRAAATTFILGHLVVQTVSNPTTSYRAYAEVGTLKTSVQSIVPPIVAGARWPLPYLDDSDLDAFAEENVAGGISPEDRLDLSTYPGPDVTPSA